MWCDESRLNTKFCVCRAAVQNWRDKNECLGCAMSAPWGDRTLTPQISNCDSDRQSCTARLTFQVCLSLVLRLSLSSLHWTISLALDTWRLYVDTQATPPTHRPHVSSDFFFNLETEKNQWSKMRCVGFFFFLHSHFCRHVREEKDEECSRGERKRRRDGGGKRRRE